MFDTLFRGIFDGSYTSVISIQDFLLCIGCSLLIGLLLAAAYTFHTQTSGSFLVSLAMLPAVVSVVIRMVNGNIGTGVAVAGAFGLVRFRSAPGTAKEIGMLFLAMSTGLISGMGYLGYSILFALLLCGIFVVYTVLAESLDRRDNLERTLRITIPEDLNYGTAFDDLFAMYTSRHALTEVKTANLGSLYKLTYRIRMKGENLEKEMMDDLRCRNGNLEILMLSREKPDTEL